MSQAVKAVESASRRELQALAKELQLCKGNVKSDVIVSHAMQFMDDHPKDGAQRVLGALGSSGNSTPVASPVAKKVTPKEEGAKKQEKTTMVASVKTNSKQVKSVKQQPEEEPTVTVKIVEVVESKIVEKQMPTKKESSADASKETPKDKNKTALAKTSPITASPTKSPKTGVKSSTTTMKSPSASAEKNKVIAKMEGPIPRKKAAPVSKKTENKSRKALEALVKSTTDLTFAGDSRVRCSTTGHEMKADVDVVSAYIHGKRYQKARNLKLSFAKYAPMFVDHPDESKPDMLWCNVTESAIIRDVKSVKKHIAAPKYQHQLPIWKEEVAAKKKAEEEEAQRRAARIEIAKKRRLEAAKEGAAESERPAKRKRSAANSDRK